MRSKYKIGQSCEERLSVARLPALLLVLLGLLVLQPSRGHLPVAAPAFFYLLLVAKQISRRRGCRNGFSRRRTSCCFSCWRLRRRR